MVSAGGHRVSVAELIACGGQRYVDELSFSASVDGGQQRGGSVSQSFGAHFCEVEVDEEIGRAAVTRWVAVMDCGRVLNRRWPAIRSWAASLLGGWAWR